MNTDMVRTLVVGAGLTVTVVAGSLAAHAAAPGAPACIVQPAPQIAVPHAPSLRPHALPAI